MTIKSQDELPQSGRDNSTLIEVISKLETTTKQLEIAVEALEWYDGLEYILFDWTLFTGQKTGTAKESLEQIKELEK